MAIKMRSIRHRSATGPPYQRAGGMRANLIMESSRWAKVNQRKKAINTLSLTLITQACETFLIQNTRPGDSDG